MFSPPSTMFNWLLNSFFLRDQALKIKEAGPTVLMEFNIH